KSVELSATQTFYQFSAGGVDLNLTFTSPLLPDNLDLFSRPANYISFEVRSGDNQPHEVQLYFSAAGNMAVNTPDQQVSWKRSHTGNLDLMRVGTERQNILGRKGDDVRIDWGYLYLGTPDKKGGSSAIASSSASVSAFVSSGTLAIKDDQNKPRSAGERPITLAACYDLGEVKSKTEKRHVILAYDQIHSIEYFHKELNAWWKRKGMTTKEMLIKAEKNYAKVLRKCDRFDKKLQKQMLAAGGEKYAK